MAGENQNPETIPAADANIQALASMFGSQIGPMLRPLIEMAIGNALRAHVGGTPYGPTALFGQQNAGGNLVDYFDRSTRSAIMQGTQQSVAAGQQEFRIAMQQTMGLARPAAEAASARFGMANFAADLLYNQLQPAHLQAGIQQAISLGGARAPLGLSGAALATQLGINQAAQTFANGMMTDYRQNFTQYSGLGGRDVGQLVAEAARTGRATFGDVPGSIAAVRGMAGVVSAAGAFFGGSALQKLDQMNAISGMDMHRSLGADSAQTVLARLEASARVNMLEPEQMVSFAEQSAAFSRSMGRDSFGALGTASSIASYYSGAVRSGGKFVNEQRLRETLVRRVTGAQESDLARAISGAAAGMDEGHRAAFIAAATTAGGAGGLTLSKVAQLAGAQGVMGTGRDFLNRGYTDDAEAFRAAGGATNAVMAGNIGQMGAMRRRTVAAFLGVGEGSLGQGNTLAEIAAGRSPEVMGELTRVLDRQAKAFGYGSMRELDATMKAQQDVAQQQAVLANQTFITRGFAGIGRVRGALGLMNFVMQAQADPSKRNFAAGWAAIGGDTSFNWDDATLNSMLGGVKGGKRTGGALSDILKAGNNDTEVFLGTDVLMNALHTGALGNRLLSPDEYSDYKGILSGGATKGNLDKIRALATHAGASQKRELSIFKTKEFLKESRGAGNQLTDAALGREAAFREGLKNVTGADQGAAAAYLMTAGSKTADEISETGTPEGAKKIAELRNSVEFQNTLNTVTEAVGAGGQGGGMAAQFLTLFKGLIDGGSQSLKVTGGGGNVGGSSPSTKGTQ